MLSSSRFFIRTLLLILVSTVAWIALTASAAIEVPEFKKLNADANRKDGLAAWQKVYSVLTSPRCINCHTATNYPQQETIAIVTLPMSFVVRKAKEFPA